MSKLIRHYCALVALLRELGFVAVTFSIMNCLQQTTVWEY
jgi:hypothetical protein